MFPIGKEGKEQLRKPLESKSVNESANSIELEKEIARGNELTNEVRVLCWIMTNPKNHRSKAAHVKQTWGRRCNILLFMSSEIGINIPFKNFINRIKCLKYLHTIYYDSLTRTSCTLSDPELPTIKLNLDHDGRDTLWGKTKQAFQYVYENYR